MKKSICSLFLALFLAFLTGNVCAQTGDNAVHKITVGNIEYTAKEKTNSKDEAVSHLVDALAELIAPGKELHGRYQNRTPHFGEMARHGIMAGLGKVRRLQVYDGRIPEGQMADGEKVYEIAGVLTDISPKMRTEPATGKDKDQKRSYRCVLTLNVRLLDYLTGQVLNTHTFSVAEYETSWQDTPGKALDAAMSKLSSSVAYYYNRMFPISGTVIERGEVKKNKQKELYIDLGSAVGAYAGLHFNIYSVKLIAGREAKTEVGRLRIEEVQGEDLSLCKVTHGGEHVKDALDSGARLLVVSYE